jgi:hypothetical protein
MGRSELQRNVHQYTTRASLIFDSQAPEGTEEVEILRVVGKPHAL